MPDSGRMGMDEIKAILESLLYVSDEPVKEEEILGVFPPADSETARSALSELLLEYAGTPRGLRIVHVAGGYRMQTRPEHDPWIRNLYRLRHRTRLSRAALETLAIIAYRQPVTTPEIQSIRGINPLGVIQTLLERRMIRTLGRKKVVGKPILYGTTDEFLVHFGLNTLSDLPSLEEFPDLASAAPEPGPGIPAVMEGLPSSGPEIRALAAEDDTRPGEFASDQDTESILRTLPGSGRGPSAPDPGNGSSDEEE